MRIIKKVKNNLFLIIIVLIYLMLFIVSPEISLSSIKNSAYYLKEMLMIMPVIFVLTALLDMWVPKKQIIKHLGKESKTKGIILSFVVGSISAGPIYAAFPMCVMLHKKGASIRNIVIILSSWAVIKVPMLLTELKFLGLKFMVIRWILTVLAIIIFSWFTAKIVKDEDLIVAKKQTGLTLKSAACMGCTLCIKSYPELFEMQQNKAIIKVHNATLDMKKLRLTIAACPVNAIEYFEDENRVKQVELFV